MNAKKKEFIKQLASFLVGNQAGKSIALEVEARSISSQLPGPFLATEWAALRNASPVFGYATHEEAVKQLTEFLK